MKHLQLAVFLVLFLSCERLKNEKVTMQDVAINQEDQKQMMLADTVAPVSSFSPAKLSDEPPKQKEKNQSAQPPVNKPDWNKKIIKTASLNIEVKDSKAYIQKVLQTADRFGGYIADEQQNETTYKIENVLTIKVPVEQFQSAVDFLTTGDGKINEKKITSEDVTTKYIDTKSRLEAKRQVRLRYLDLLKQAKNMEEILQVQSEINDIQEEIESAAGRINYLSGASAMSTIQLTFFQVVNPSAKNTDNQFWGKFKDAFVTGWKGAADVLIGFVYIWPLLLIVISGIWFTKRVIRKKESKTKVQTTV
jgi:Domain of unknown function (DUF4349)